MNTDYQALLNSANEVFAEIDSRGIRVSLETIDSAVKNLEGDLQIIFSRNLTDSTKSLKKKAEAYARTIPNWPLDSRSNPKLNQEVCSSNGAEILMDYVKANSIARRITALKNLVENGKGLDLLSKFSSSSEMRLFTEHRVKDDMGRVYVAGFNYTNLPKENRNIVIGDKDGDQIWSLDVSSAELVALATLANDEVLASDLRSADFHSSFAAKLFKKDLADVTPEERKQAKTVTFAILYGATELYLCSELKISESQATILLNSFGLQYKKAGEFIKKTYEKTMLSGVSETYFGTKRTFEASDKTGKSGVSHAIQSTAGEVVRTQLKIVSDWAKANNGVVWGVQFDSYLMSLPSTVSEDDVKNLVSLLEKNFFSLGFEFRLKVENCGQTWK